MADRYVKAVLKLATNLTPSEENGQSGAMEKKLAHISRLAHECQIAEELKKREHKFTPNFIAWVKDELKLKYTYKTSDKLAPTLFNVCKYRERSIVPVFYNIVYCVLERYGVQYQHKSRKRTISFEEFCALTGNNRKTLSRGQTIFYTPNKIQEIWLKDNESGGLLLDIVIRIAKEIEEKIKEL